MVAQGYGPAALVLHLPAGGDVFVEVLAGQKHLQNDFAIVAGICLQRRLRLVNPARDLRGGLGDGAGLRASPKANGFLDSGYSQFGVKVDIATVGL